VPNGNATLRLSGNSNNIAVNSITVSDKPLLAPSVTVGGA